MSLSRKGTLFEQDAACVFRDNSYTVIDKYSLGKPSHGDGGIDLILVSHKGYDGGHRVAVECKHFADGNLVGRDVIQKFLTAMREPAYDTPPFNFGYVVTTSRFTNDAIKYTYKINKRAQYTRIRLIDCDDLESMGYYPGIRRHSCPVSLYDFNACFVHSLVDIACGLSSSIGPFYAPYVTDSKQPDVIEHSDSDETNIYKTLFYIVVFIGLFAAPYLIGHALKTFFT